MSNNRVLIVGAGAGGFVTGYYLSLAGAEVTFYVRPKRVQELQPPQLLFSYDDCELKTYKDYNLVCDMQKVAEQSFDFVLVTLDGYTAFSEEGSQLLESLGKAVVNSNAVVINLGVGVGIKDHYIKATGLPESRIISGTFLIFSHFVATADLSAIAHAPAKASDVAKARLGYRHVSGKTGVVIENANRDAAKRFATMYNNNGFSQCKPVNPTFTQLMFNLLFPFFAASELSGWTSTNQIVHDKNAWPLACKAANEIAALPRFGLLGKVLSKLMVVALWRNMWLKMDKDSRPLDYNAFNKMHHGNKVVEQDTQVMRQNLALGQQAGFEMPHLKTLLERLDEHRQ